MSKKSNVTKVINALINTNRNYKVLSTAYNLPNHIRVTGFGDIWPTTGTFQLEGKQVVKRQFNALMNALSNEKDQPIERPKTNKELIIELQDCVEFLNERVEHLESLINA